MKQFFLAAVAFLPALSQLPEPEVAYAGLFAESWKLP